MYGRNQRFNEIIEMSEQEIDALKTIIDGLKLSDKPQMPL